ncbi:MAG TPA: aminoglycoside 6-adenylyltransferase [Anaerolineae bacterium]|nr:aminoglycoside 6-adenylyltransferase [Anaerolineae bacterium]HQI84847.1 aminoglycoside 6-adenylyltransferase [Anaerolineae bacterium]
MNDVNEAYEHLIRRFVWWAQNEDNVRAALVIGSRARVDHPADEWSDLDIIILAHDPEPYWAATDWLHNVGGPWLTFVEPLPIGNGFERRVLFEGGLDVDFVPNPVAPFRRMLDEGHLGGLADLIHRGVRFLVDKEGFAEQLARIPAALPPYQPPAESEFLNLVHDFWYHTVWTAKKLRRGELWTAKSCCDSYLKQLLRQMLEWHTRAHQNEAVNTWMRGRFLEEWADARAVAALPAIFAHYDEADVWRALQATMELFHWLALETAKALGYAYPAFGEERATETVGRLFNG